MRMICRYLGRRMPAVPGGIGTATFEGTEAKVLLFTSLLP